MTIVAEQTKSYTDDNSIKPLLGMTFGCDPEIFVRDDKGLLCFPEFIPGTKEEPFKVKKGAIQRDGMAAEINIDPAESFTEFRDNIYEVTNQLQKMLPKGYSLSYEGSVIFPEDVWERVSEEDKALGCSPDYNAWEMTVNEPPDGDTVPRMRTAAGHLHIGWDENVDVTDTDHVKDCCELVKQLDWYLGSYTSRVDPDKRRASLYGKAGSCRIKDYGVEYRVPSNYWLKNEGNILEVWNRMQRGISSMRNNYLPEVTDQMMKKRTYSRRKYTFNDRLIRSINSGKLDESLSEIFPQPILFV